MAEYYCPDPDCACILTEDERFTHRDEVHGDEPTHKKPEIREVVERDDERIARSPDDRGHYGPHVWIAVDEQVMCGDCGAVLLDADPSEYP